MAATSLVARGLSDGARRGALDLDALPTLGHRLGTLLLAGALEAPFVGAVRHHAETRIGVRELQRELQRELLGGGELAHEPRALVFTDTFAETNGVAGTMRLLAAGGRPRRAAAAGRDLRRRHRPAASSRSRPTGRFRCRATRRSTCACRRCTQVLAFVEREQPDAIHVATPGPVGLCGLAAAKTLGLPLVGSYHTELGPYALHLTRDLLVAEAFDRYVDWFYRQCALVLGPTAAVADALAQKGMTTSVWGRGVDTAASRPSAATRRCAHACSATATCCCSSSGACRPRSGSTCCSKRSRGCTRRDARRAPRAGGRRAESRRASRRGAPSGTTFLGELHGDDLATLYASADAFCFPSTTDTFGQVILEAAASGLPAAAAAAGGALELVQRRAHRPARAARRPDRAGRGDPRAVGLPGAAPEVRAGCTRGGARPHVAALLRRAHPARTELVTGSAVLAPGRRIAA